MSTTRLNPDFRHVVTDAYAVLKPDPSARVPDDRHETLRANLERAIVEPTYYAELRGHLRSLNATGIRSKPLSDQELSDALAQGLRHLDATRLAGLAVDPVGLLSLRECVVQELTDYWWAVVKQHAEESGEMRSTDEMLAEAVAKTFPQKRGAAKNGALVGAFNGNTTAADATHWLSPLTRDNGTPTERAEFHIAASGLEVRIFFDGLVLTSSKTCAATLRDAAGSPVADATAADRKLVFALPDGADLRGWTLSGVVRQEGKPDISFTAAVR